MSDLIYGRGVQRCCQRCEFFPIILTHFFALKTGITKAIDFDLGNISRMMNEIARIAPRVMIIVLGFAI